MKSESRKLFERAQKRIPGGVNSPVRAFKSVGGEPRYIRSGRGSRMTDVDGKSYIDYVGSWGPLILGHCPPGVRSALEKQVRRGTSFGACSAPEVTLAEMICEAFPSIEKVRLVNSGTEATMSAIRLARAITGRYKIVKFDGCYHGHADGLLVQAGSGVATLGLPDSPGVPPQDSALTISVPYNDMAVLERVFAANRSGIAAVIVEPIAGNMGTVLPAPGFLPNLKKLTREYGGLLIFDEVMTGFRVAYGGAQEVFGVRPDLTCLGKIIGGGLPVGAYGGKKEFMSYVAPEGPVYQAGTLSGNPLAVTAGIATLKALQKKGTYNRLERLGAALEEGFRQAAFEGGIPVRINRAGSMFTLFFTDRTVTDYASAKLCDTGRFGKYFHRMLENGIYLPPSQFEACFVSLAHSRNDVSATAVAARRALRTLLD